MGAMSIWHWLIVLVVVLVIFGPAKLSGLGKGLGEGIRNFKKGLDPDDESSKKQLTDSSKTELNEPAKRHAEE